jgi:hypothetical protein
MWKLRITYKKKSKKKVDQFKFETPTTPQVDELNPTQTSIQPSQQIEPFRNIETDSILYVEKIEDYKVFINDFNNNPINCFFTVWAERIDIPKLVVEYENGTIL